MSVYFFLATFIPFSLFATLVYLYTLDQFKDNIDNRNTTSAKLIVRFVEKSMENIQYTLEQCAERVDENAGHPDKINMLLQAVTMANDEIHELRLLNRKGVVYALAPYFNDVMGNDMSNYPSFQERGA